MCIRDRSCAVLDADGHEANIGELLLGGPQVTDGYWRNAERTEAAFVTRGDQTFYRTGDIVEAHHEACAGGRTSMRLGPVLGRKQHMVKYKGTTLYPPVLNDLLASFLEVEASVVIIDRDELGHDEVVVNILCAHRSDALVDKLKEHIRATLRVVPRLEFVDPQMMAELQGAGRKKATVLDRRG